MGTNRRSKSNIPDSDPEQKASDTSSMQSGSMSVVDYKQDHLLRELSATRNNIRSSTESLELLEELCFENTGNSMDVGQTSDESLSSSGSASKMIKYGELSIEVRRLRTEVR